MDFITEYIQNCNMGSILHISENSTAFDKFMQEVNNDILWGKFVNELICSYNNGDLNFNKHGQMMATATSLNRLPRKTQYSCVNVKSLPFLFLLMPNYVLSCHYSSFMENLVTCKERNMPFFSFVYFEHEEYSSWFMAGIHQYLATSTDISKIVACLNELPPHSPFLINLTPADLRELYIIYKVNPQCIERLLRSTSSMLYIKCLHLIECQSTELQILMDQCQQLQTNPSSLLKLILEIMNTCSNFVLILFFDDVGQSSVHSSYSSFAVSEGLLKCPHFLHLPFSTALCIFSF